MDQLETQLIDAIRASKTDIVQSLLEKGVNINFVPMCGKSPLSTAAALGDTKTMNLLLSVDKSNSSGVEFQEDFYSRSLEFDSKWGNVFSEDNESKSSQLSHKNSYSVESKRNLGYYVFVHNDEPEGFGDVNKNESLDANTPEGMDDLEWDVEVEGEGIEEYNDIWSSQYRWYANILDKTGGLVEDRVEGCDIDLQDITGQCALHYAVEHKQLEAINCLISAGCKVNIGDTDNMTPLHLAAMKGHQEIARILVEKGAKVNMKTTDKMAPLHFAAARGFVEMVTLLIRGGASLDPLDSNDRTPLMLAVSRGHTEVVEILIQCGAKVNIEEIHGYTPLCEAVWSKSIEMADMLLKAGAKQTQSQHLLHYTVLHRHLAMAELLLRYGAYPNLRDDYGDPPLLIAVACSHLDMIKLLLQYDANPNGTNSVTNNTPLHRALESSKQNDTYFEELVKLLCLYNVDLDQHIHQVTSTPLLSAVMHGHVRCAATLIRAGADVNNKFNIINQSEAQQYHFLDLVMTYEMDSLAYLVVAAGYDMRKYKAAFPSDFSKLDLGTCKGWLTYMKYNPLRLVDLCRLRIRKQLGNRVFQLVPALEIPESLKKFLLFKEMYIQKASRLKQAED